MSMMTARKDQDCFAVVSGDWTRNDRCCVVPEPLWRPLAPHGMRLFSVESKIAWQAGLGLMPSQ